MRMSSPRREKEPVPREYRRYIRRSDIPKLPQGTRVHRGTRGGLYVDIREVPKHELERLESEPAIPERAEEEVSPVERDIKIMEDFAEIDNYRSVFDALEYIDMRLREDEESFYSSIEQKYFSPFKLMASRIKKMTNPQSSLVSEEQFNLAMDEFLFAFRGYYRNLIEDFTKYYGEEYGEWVRRYGKMLVLFRGYASINYENFTVALEVLEKRFRGDTRFGFYDSLKMQGWRWSKEFERILSDISDEEYREWLELNRKVFETYVKRGQERVRLWRGISVFEYRELLMNKILGRPLQINTILFSTTVDKEVAKEFTNHMVVWFDEDGRRVVGGWWNASKDYAKQEKEVILAGDTGGTKINGISFVSLNARELWTLLDRGENYEPYEGRLSAYTAAALAIGSSLDGLTQHYLEIYRRSPSLSRVRQIGDEEMRVVYERLGKALVDLTKSFERKLAEYRDVGEVGEERVRDRPVHPVWAYIKALEAFEEFGPSYVNKLREKGASDAIVSGVEHVYRVSKTILKDFTKKYGEQVVAP